MPSDSKISQLIIRLTKATVDKKIEWKIADPPRSISVGTDDIITSYLEAQYKGQHLGLCERRYRDYDGENDVHYWTGDLFLTIFDEDGRIIWDHREGSSALTNLYQVARDSAADIDNILSKLLE